MTGPPERQAGSLLRRERELWQLHLFWKPKLSPGLGSPRARLNLAHPTILLLRLHEAIAGA
jgi:hypothetical protein